MKIAILGGTGRFGMGLALRLAQNNEIILGSRDPARAKVSALTYQRLYRKQFPDSSVSITGDDNVRASMSSEMTIFSLKLAPALELARSLRDLRREQIVVSPIVNMNNGRVPFVASNGRFLSSQDHGNMVSTDARFLSCAEALAQKLGARDQMVSTLHTLPARRLVDTSAPIDSDVLVCGNDVKKARIVCRVVEGIQGVRAIYAGPLRLSAHIEGMAIALNAVSKYGKIHYPTIKIS